MTKTSQPRYVISEPEVTQTLSSMESDLAYNTTSSYTADSTTYPTNVITFTQKHLAYLKKNPHVNPDEYISNLRLMMRLK